MLYILTFSTYVFSFITVPYLTRILGPQNFGIIGYSMAVSLYFQLFIDFGFILSGTEEVSRHRNNINKVRKIYTSINIIKLIISILSIFVFFLLTVYIAKFQEYFYIVLFYVLTAIVKSFLPDYIYRGLEKMTSITIRTVSIRLFSMVGIFVLVDSPKKIILVPVFDLLSNSIAVYLSYRHLKKEFKIKFSFVEINEIFQVFNSAKVFFLSRIVSTLYTTTNTFIVSKISDVNTLGYYSAADKLMSTGKSLFSPISDSIYPYMVRNKDLGLVKKILIITTPITIMGSIVLYYYAYDISSILLGKNFRETGAFLRALTPIVVITLPEYILGFPTLTCIGLSRYANYSIYFGTTIFFLCLIFLNYSHNLSAISLCYLTSLTEFCILMYRIVIVLKNKKMFNGNIVEL